MIRNIILPLTRSFRPETRFSTGPRRNEPCLVRVKRRSRPRDLNALRDFRYRGGLARHRGSHVSPSVTGYGEGAYGRIGSTGLAPPHANHA